LLAAAGAVGALAVAATAIPAAADSGHDGAGHAAAKHVLLLSIDGMHQADLALYIANHPTSSLARLVAGGKEFTGARTPFPSDSFPGMVGQVTGGNPRSTGVYYDDSYNRELLPAGTTSCAGVKPGVEVTYFEALAKDPLSIDSGAGLPGLPDSILTLTGNATSLIDTTKLPVDPKTCQPVFPHSYLRVNTIFEVARAAGLRTAWSDKHAAYDILNGPSGAGIQDLFTPEINSNAPAPSPGDWTKDNSVTQRYDSYKVQAVINEINGFDHSGRTATPTPAIFGMNFQTISTAQKLPTSGGQLGGYLADGVTPGPVLSNALDYIDTKVGEMMAALKANHLADSTVMILSAKHGQSPTRPADLTRISDGKIFDAINAAWKAQQNVSTDLVVFSVNDDGMLIWLGDRSPEALKFVKDFLLGPVTGSGIANNTFGPKPYTRSGLVSVLAGPKLFGVPRSDARYPDLVGIAQLGTVFTGGKGKIAEHGGANPADRDVPLVVSGAPVGEPGVSSEPVETIQIAPTILELLGLNPESLQAVQLEGTDALPLD